MRKVVLNYNLKKRESLIEDSTGATVLEFALASMILIPIVFGIIDFSKYMWTKSALLKSVNSAARVAGSIDGFDKTLLTDATKVTGKPAQIYLDFSRAKLNAENTSYQLADVVSNFSNALNKDLSGMSPTDKSTLRTLPYISPILSHPKYHNRIADVAIIRPGERMEHADPENGNGTGVFTEHPTLCPTGGCVNTCQDIDGNPCPVLNGTGGYTDTDIKSIYQDHPILVEMRAEISTIIGPLLNIFGVDGNLTFKVQAYAYRESFPEGSFPQGPPTGATPCPITASACTSIGMIFGKCRCMPGSSSPSPVTDNRNYTPVSTCVNPNTVADCPPGKVPVGCSCKGPGS